MVWKQDLAKLKQQLKADGDPPPPPPPPKPVVRAELRPIQDEDALFLAAMGQRPSKPGPLPSVEPVVREPLATPPPPEAPVEDFSQAMGGLKGLKALDRDPLLAAAAKPAAPVVPAPEPPAPAPVAVEADPGEDTQDIPPPPPSAFKEPPGPRLIQLAAGMAVEVDGLLDLRGHSLTDARERLKERIQDAQVLGWRTMHVILGPSEALRQGFLAFLVGPAASALVRYAQAPVPMGGSQAWILYFGGPAA